MSARLALPLLMVLHACVPATQSEMPTRAVIAESTLPPMKTFGTARPPATLRPNSEIAADFLDLAFQMESGRALPVLTRFETPITLRVTGTPPATLGPDLHRLLTRLRNESGVDIQLTTRKAANITINAVASTEIRKILPEAACFVAPNVSTLEEFRAARRSSKTSWSELRHREKLAVFVPNDVSPQEIRDCLHEELAQALGPLNDLYRLPDSVFNDDNVHTVLTGFDMLILRAYYDPALKSGMTRAEVAANLPDILSRLNPQGDVASRPVQPSPRAWSEAIQNASGRSASYAGRVAAANEAIRIATALNWQDNRRAFSHYAMAQVMQSTDPEGARAQYIAADRFYANAPETRLHRANVAAQLAAYAISQGDGAQALAIVAPHITVARQHENAALLTTLLLMQSEALELESRSQEARSVRLDSIGWARYGFGPDWAVRAKLREIASLNPLKR
ncbi:Protein of unknown function [Sulfitobacter brevis]|uniref:ATP-dependent transcriptional regulator n=1 Tax=Sulfitobacter brevis TaxID=74348 RepID=A0A1I1V6P1_9RHOB|nr:DUF2927 domain-containing protein [Sulfitobacter brevis]SFD77698.1 Protein of unknown function [Sulfitobacter brevis]